MRVCLPERLIMTFEQWMKQVDSLIAVNYGGLTSEDLPDYCWYDLFEDEYTPQEAVEDYIEANF